MNYLSKGIIEAFKLIFTFDTELYRVIGLSLFVSISAVIISSLFCVITGVWLGITDFKGRRVFSKILYSLMSIPSVVVGLLFFLMFSRSGPLGFMKLLYTPQIMIIAQAFLISPLILGLVYNNTRIRGREIMQEGVLLGAGKIQVVFLIMREMKKDYVMHMMTGFSRAISEVGCVMIVGGNIKGFTRVMTTSIAMMNSMGEYESAIALGIILLAVSLIINIIIYKEE